MTVNGYFCRNCADVEFAKRHVDPTRPKDGPNGIYATDGDVAKRTPAIAAIDRVATSSELGASRLAATPLLDIRV